jgi:hypothetical protein
MRIRPLPKALLLMAVVFSLGVIVGASLATTFVSRKLAATEPQRHGDPRQKLLEKFKSRLQLSPEQTAQMQAILDETHGEFSQLHQSVKPQFDALRDRMRSRIREILNQSQKQEFEVMTAEFERKEKNRFR